MSKFLYAYGKNITLGVLVLANLSLIVATLTFQQHFDHLIFVVMFFLWCLFDFWPNTQKVDTPTYH